MTRRARRSREETRARSKVEPDRSAPGGGPEEGSAPRPWSREWLVDWLKTLVFAFLIFLVLRTFVIASFVITSGSMEDTLLVGDFLLVNRVVLGSPVPGTALRIPGYGEPRRGDIIVFRADHAPGLDIVKRLVGLPGDTLHMEGGALHVNGVRQEEAYAIHDPDEPDASDPDMAWQLQHLAPGVDRAAYRPTRDEWGPIVVPEERYFMLGDNREHSLDSRYWGFVERRKMKGKPFFIYYSYDRNVLKPFPFVTAMRPGRIGPSPH